MSILGIHHITLVSSNAQRTAEFYTKVLGQRLIKRTINYDDPSSYHIYFGDETGKPGTAITFFEWAHAPKGKHGVGGTHHFAMRVKDETALLKWKRRLHDMNIPTKGIYDRHYFKSLYFQDPDGVNLEIATDGPGWTMDEPAESIGTVHQNPPEAMMIANRDEAAIAGRMWHEPVPFITPDMALMDGMHHITAIASNIRSTHAFYTDILGMKRVKMTSNFDDPKSAHWYWGVDGGKPGSLITYFERDLKTTRYAEVGIGMTHHFAFAVENEDVQRDYQKRLTKAGYRVSQIMDRQYFKSIYTHDPDGHIVELATMGPGFLVDEPVETLGESLRLPSWLESQRDQISSILQPITVEKWQNPLK
ncbi:MAG: VOC family protein [bacterium]|nr:VOC family protein [bacterium]